MRDLITEPRPRGSRFSTRRFWFGIGVIAVVLITVAIWIAYSRNRRIIQDDRDLVRLLPPGAGTLLFIDLKALRQAGFANLIESGSAATLDSESKDFIRETGLHFPGDIDALAAQFADETQFGVRGNFDWTKIRRFLVQRGGTCSGASCMISTSSANKTLSLSRVQSDVAFISISPQANARASIPSATTPQAAQAIPDAPAWIRFDRTTLAHPEQLPPPARPFVLALGGAAGATFSVQAASATSEAAFLLRLEANYPDAKTAHSAQTQLELQTKMIQLELARERKPADPANLTGLLVSGRFETEGNHLQGTWPVRRELLETLRR